MLINQLRRRFEISNRLYLDLVSHIPEALLSSKLVDLPSNSIGAQLWCVLGARNSYLKAARVGSWQGFSPPIDGKKILEAKAVTEVLLTTGQQVDVYLAESTELSEHALKLLLDLLEHEAQHHGQLARYLYGLKVGVPKSWKDRYHFD